MAAGESSGNSLENTPTWAVAIVCFIIISVSIFLEHSIHLLTIMLKRHRRTALNDAAYRLKSELMLLGLMSLLLAVAQDAISNICISRNIADIMLPCRPKETDTKLSTKDDYERFGRRNLLTTDGLYNGKLQILHRSLLADDMVDQSVISSCSSKGKVGLIAQEGIHQLQIFIIVLSVMQIVYSVLTVAFGKAKMRRWKTWEKETQTTDYLIENDPNRFSLTRQTIFGRRHESFTETWIHLWLKCFFRQFFHSIAKVDYHTLRHSFITAHLPSKSNSFNFHKYIQKSLDEDFKVVVSIRPYMWCIVVIFLLVNIHGWHTYYRWVSLVPFLIMVLIGTKLETIVVRMALRLKNHKSVIIGNPVVQPHDDLFWFNRPTFLLSLLHFTLFLNAFEVAFFIWVTIQFGWDSCYYHEHTLITIARIGLAVSVQVLCSYITLPLYALVAQMGSQFKSKLLEERMAKMLKQWHDEVKAKRKKHKEQSLQSASTSLSLDLSFRDISLPRDDQLSSDHHHHPTSMPTDHNPRTSQNIIKEEEEIVEEAHSSKVSYPII